MLEAGWVVILHMGRSTSTHITAGDKVWGILPKQRKMRHERWRHLSR